MREALAKRSPQVTNAARTQVELQSLVGINLAVLGSLRLMPQRQLKVGFVKRLTGDQLIRSGGLHRVNGCRAIESCALSRIFGEKRLAKAERDQRNAPGILRNKRECGLRRIDSH